MKNTAQQRLLLVAMLLVSATGCASIISGRHVEVPINSTPPGADVTIRNIEGELIAQATTPARVSLKRGRGLFRAPPNYVATIEKNGYQPQSVAIEPHVNPWIAGNIALGGVIGLAADSATGAIWKFSPGEINYVLSPEAAAGLAAQTNEAVVQTGYSGTEEPE